LFPFVSCCEATVESDLLFVLCHYGGIGCQGGYLSIATIVGDKTTLCVGGTLSMAQAQLDAGERQFGVLRVVAIVCRALFCMLQHIILVNENKNRQKLRLYLINAHQQYSNDQLDLLQYLILHRQ